MYRNKTFNRKKVMIVFVAVFFIMMFLIGRLVYLMIFGTGKTFRCKRHSACHKQICMHDLCDS